MKFAYRLAKELGIWDVEGMLRSMTWRQYLGWILYASEEPFGEERADLRSAIVAAVVANANRDSRRRPRPFSPRDFMPLAARANRSPRRAPVTDSGQFRKLTTMMRAAFGERDREKSR